VRLTTRIAVTFLGLLGAVLAAALLAVSAANRANAEREIARQLATGGLVFERALEANRRQLIQAAQVLAADFGFREAVATHDADTLGSALENHAARIGASLVVLVSLDGRVLAAAGSAAIVGTPFAHRDVLQRARGSERIATVAAENGRVYQLVMVPVRSPLPVAWIVMGFAIDEAAVRELAAVTGLDVTLAVRAQGGWESTATSLAAGSVPMALAGLASARSKPDGDLLTRALSLAPDAERPVTAILSRSLAEARRPFDLLSQRLVLIALASLSLSTVAAFWLARNITRPLKALTAAVEDIRGGRYDAPLVVERRDELGTLAEGLQLMQRAVESRDRDIRALAYTDRLTGLKNRAAFTEALGSALADRGRPVAVALINVRRFRRINECLGYPIGDSVLRQIAARLIESPQLAAQVARVAGDHFAAFTPLAPGTSPEQWGAQLLQRLAAPVEVDAQLIDVSTSVGLACAPADSTDADDLLRCADLAVERARRENLALRVYDASLRAATREQLSLLGELQRAIDHDELLFVFQPKLRLDTGALVGAEALVRWRHPLRGLLLPGAFVPFAEQTGFVRKLTRWGLLAAARTGAAWQAAGRPLSLAVNVSADDLADFHLDGYVRQVLTDTGLDPALLTLEITESGFIADPDRALARLEALRAIGVRLSIDDFGTGYSSLSYLARMAVDELKIDRSFVAAVATSAEVGAVVRAAVDMGHSLGLTLVGEGIEDAATAARLAALGCDLGQGYLYAKPLPIADFDAWRAAHHPAAAPLIAAPDTGGAVTSLKLRRLLTRNSG
jgi:diguanylate cyclase (GGDEF)-like protein